MTYSLDAIKAIIPHREPFILIDRITENVSLNFTVSEHDVRESAFWVPGHFPGNPVMPGVLMVEAMAQTGAVNILTMPEYNGKIGYFSSIQDVKFKRKVVPGDILVIKATYLSQRAAFFFFEGEAFVNDQLVCSARFSVAVAR
jgi:3-hydroxyacyl-[acyl-carrier-protein] dehydratase